MINLTPPLTASVFGSTMQTAGITTNASPTTFSSTKTPKSTTTPIPNPMSTTLGVGEPAPIYKPGPTHLELTNSKKREKIRAQARLISISQQTPTVKSFTFKVENTFEDPQLLPHVIKDLKDLTLKGHEEFKFKAGQWVDFFHPEFDIVGGFSITSTLQTYQKTRTFELAIKQAYVNPLVKWLHNKAAVGDLVQVRVGGNFYLQPSEELEGREMVLLAGGVGITPLFAMAGQFIDDFSLHRTSRQTPRMTLLCTAKEHTELLFRSRLLEWAEESKGLFEPFFYVTRDNLPPLPASERVQGIDYKRISKDILKDHLEKCKRRSGGLDPVIYMCGPADFERSVVGWLAELGHAEEFVRFEQWW
ncbi:Oxidoreductase NAD-binding domain-containing protein 1 [Chytridiales sp. JEL 0842]|nr:Oxidoreductase NAD-binding domain-containing protein 1 [Chytridiales sp. JEL 0842]